MFVKNLRSVKTREKQMADGKEMMFGRGMLMSSSYNVTPEELFDLFGKFGPIR